MLEMVQLVHDGGDYGHCNVGCSMLAETCPFPPAHFPSLQQLAFFTAARPGFFLNHKHRARKTREKWRRATRCATGAPLVLASNDEFLGVEAFQNLLAQPDGPD